MRWLPESATISCQVPGTKARPFGPSAPNRACRAGPSAKPEPRGMPATCAHALCTRASGAHGNGQGARGNGHPRQQCRNMPEESSGCARPWPWPHRGDLVAGEVHAANDAGAHVRPVQPAVRPKREARGLCDASLHAAMPKPACTARLAICLAPVSWAVQAGKGLAPLTS